MRAGFRWDINEAGAWPKPIKIAAGILVFVLILAGGFYQFTSDKLTQLEAEEKGVADALNSYRSIC